MELEELAAPSEPVHEAPMELDGDDLCGNHVFTVYASLVDLPTGGCTALADAARGALGANHVGVEAVSIGRPGEGRNVHVTVKLLSGEIVTSTFDVAAPGAPDVVDRVAGVVVADPSITGMATTAPRAALAFLQTPAHAFAGPYASSAGLRVPPPPLLDGRVVRFFGSDEPVGDALSGLGRGAGASLSEVSRDRGAPLGRLMALLQGGSCDRGALCFEACSPRAAVLAPSMPTVSADCIAVARAWQEISQRTHKKKHDREAFQKKPLDDKEDAVEYVKRSLVGATKKGSSFYKTLANAIGEADIGAAAQRDAVFEALDGVSAADLLIIGSLPESSEASGGGGVLVPSTVVDEGNPGIFKDEFTDEDRKLLVCLNRSRSDSRSKIPKDRLEKALARHRVAIGTDEPPKTLKKKLKVHLEKLLKAAADSDSETFDMADLPLGDATNGAQRQPNTAAPRAGPQKTCPACDAKVSLRKARCDCGHVFVSKKQRDATAAAPRPPRPDRKKIKVESAEDRASRERVDAWRALEFKVEHLSTARLPRDRTILKGDIHIALGLLGAPQQLLNPSNGHSDEHAFKVFADLAQEHGVSMAPRDSATILEHGVDFLKKVVVELSKLENAKLAEKLDAVKDRSKEGKIAKMQVNGNLVKNPEVQKMGTMAAAAAGEARVQTRGMWRPLGSARAKARQQQLGYYDSDQDECDARNKYLRYLQFDHGPRVDLSSSAGLSYDSYRAISRTGSTTKYMMSLLLLR